MNICRFEIFESHCRLTGGNIQEQHQCCHVYTTDKFETPTAGGKHSSICHHHPAYTLLSAGPSKNLAAAFLSIHLEGDKGRSPVKQAPTRSETKGRSQPPNLPWPKLSHTLNSHHCLPLHALRAPGAALTHAPLSSLTTSTFIIPAFTLNLCC